MTMTHFHQMGTVIGVSIGVFLSHFFSFSYDGVCKDVLKLSVSDVLDVLDTKEQSGRAKKLLSALKNVAQTSMRLYIDRACN